MYHCIREDTEKGGKKQTTGDQSFNDLSATLYLY